MDRLAMTSWQGRHTSYSMLAFLTIACHSSMCGALRFVAVAPLLVIPSGLLHIVLEGSCHLVCSCSSAWLAGTGVILVCCNSCLLCVGS